LFYSIINAMSTKKIFYNDPNIVNWKSRITDIKKEKDFYILSLSETIFYPEGGGQPCDKGEIRSDDWILLVSYIWEEDGKIWHKGILKGKREPLIDEKVELYVDSDLRREYMEQHTAQHLLSAIIEKNYSLETTGFQILGDHTKIEIPYRDFDPKSFVNEIESIVNKYIKENIPVNVYWKDENIRIVEIVGLDINPCGGLHVNRLGEIGLFKILDFYKKNNDLWRVEFVAGSRILKRLSIREEEYKYIKEKLGNPDIYNGISKLFTKLETLEKDNKRLRERINKYMAKELIDMAENKENIKIILNILEEDMNTIKFVVQEMMKENGILGVIFNSQGQGIIFRSPDISTELFNKILEKLTEIGWKGSRGEYFLQGKVEDPEKAIDYIKSLL
jgi:alanyl-tRNA synthetase